MSVHPVLIGHHMHDQRFDFLMERGEVKVLDNTDNDPIFVQQPEFSPDGGI